MNMVTAVNHKIVVQNISRRCMSCKKIAKIAKLGRRLGRQRYKQKQVHYCIRSSKHASSFPKKGKLIINLH